MTEFHNTVDLMIVTLLTSPGPGLLIPVTSVAAVASDLAVIASRLSGIMNVVCTVQCTTWCIN